jgi:hypothetical protein
LPEVIRATGSRIPARLLLAAAFWSFMIIGVSGDVAYAISGVASLALGSAAFLVVVRRVGWWSLVMPYVRPVPFLGYWLWAFFAPPGRKDGWTEWAAWLLVLSPFLAAIIW